MGTTREQRSYDHRLVRAVQETRDRKIATSRGVPRSTVAGWLRRAPTPVLTGDPEGEERVRLELRVAALDARNARLLVLSLRSAA
jgi:hypothetical protein